MLAFRRLIKNAVIKENFRSLSTIPVNSVASFWKYNVGNENNAIFMDKLIKEKFLPVLKSQPGFVKANRMVFIIMKYVLCKIKYYYN